VNPAAGPLDTPPPISSTEADEMLDQALAGLTLGAWDREVLAWMRQSHPGEQAAIASWLRRSWAAGVVVGRAERELEARTYHEAMQRARDALDGRA
jgi:hypothetical protein